MAVVVLSANFRQVAGYGAWASITIGLLIHI